MSRRSSLNHGTNQDDDLKKESPSADGILQRGAKARRSRSVDFTAARDKRLIALFQYLA